MGVEECGWVWRSGDVEREEQRRRVEELGGWGGGEEGGGVWESGGVEWRRVEELWRSRCVDECGEW
jgi:hypothetical protein